MGIGGGIITRKLLFAVLLVSSLSLAGITGASASEIGNAQTQTVNSSTVQEKANIQINNTYNLHKSATTQNSTDENVKTAANASIATVKTTTNQTTTTKTVTSSNPTSISSKTTEMNTASAVSTADVKTKNSVNTSSTNTANNTTDAPKAAAGETKVATNFTTSQINDAAARVKAYVETNHQLPVYVTIGTTQVAMPDFLKLLVTGLLQINSGSTTVTLKTVNAPSKPVESITSGSITKTNYIDLASRVNNYINANGVLPNYANSNLGKLSYENLIYIYSKILNYYKTNNKLPNYVTVKPWSTIGTTSTTTTSTNGTATAAGTSTSVPASLQQYLQATANCQVNNAQIQALAKSIASSKTTTYDKAAAIYNWVRDNLGYSFYYNTKYGAVGALNAKTGNCVDTAHLVVALERAAGIPARYEHVKARFSSGNWYGHVIAQVWVNGKWYNADATSSRNSFGVVNNWNTATATIYGTYASLPF